MLERLHLTMVRFGRITKHPTWVRWGWHSYVSYVHISLILPLPQYHVNQVLLYSWTASFSISAAIKLGLPNCWKSREKGEEPCTRVSQKGSWSCNIQWMHWFNDFWRGNQGIIKYWGVKFPSNQFFETTITLTTSLIISQASGSGPWHGQEP